MSNDSNEETLRETPKGYPLQWVEGIRPDDADDDVETVDDK